MRFGLIVFGDELLSGKRQDAHVPKLIELLAARGLELDWARYVRDGLQAQAAALRAAWASGDAVFCCGGIGATPDDHTRQAAALALGVALQPHPEAQALIRARAAEMAAEKGEPAPDDAHPDMRRRLEMGVFPAGSTLIPNPYNRIAGFSLGRLHFVPGFPVMAHPMMAWVLDQHYAHLHRPVGVAERSCIVQNAFEAQLTPLMEDIEARFAPVKVFSLPSVDHPQWGRCIELGVKAARDDVQLLAAYQALRQGLIQFGASISTEMVR
ncbi:molybdopterin-biosynthesis enzyme MoeA-like protein [Inhella inkyongensis]|uniref:Molybdopterin-biosynthesis enzyme MoeA-like protein n=1 Tax=Inhella inkyongensis TaxID=392593 RepID=A0A840RY87_9BURK|nr:molybdopterin-binding protein [Inhella inkyongensis]MBB5203677.1 molybdopterin-biosynthesis enzyme MoeA-like protein [Inhella inkyongensis]